jgi:hypothetical protein
VVMSALPRGVGCMPNEKAPCSVVVRRGGLVVNEVDLHNARQRGSI